MRTTRDPATREAPSPKTEIRSDGKPQSAPAAGSEAYFRPLGDGAAGNGGEPLPPNLREPLEAYHGRPLSHVRLHAGPDAARTAQSRQARALTDGSDIYFAPGVLRTDTREGVRTLAHEVAHVVQPRAGTHRGLHPQSERYAERAAEDFIRGAARPSTAPPTVGHGALLRDPNDRPVPVLVAGEPLQQYTVLQGALSSADWTALNHAADQRARDFAAQRNLEAPEGQRQIREVTVPVRALFRPTTSPDVPEDWLLAAFNRARGQLSRGERVDLADAADHAEKSILKRWLEANSELLDRTVRVALLDPGGLTAAPPTLVFQLDGTPIPTLDGGLYAVMLDRFGTQSLDQARGDATRQLENLQDALGDVAHAEAVLASGRRVAERGPTQVRRELVEDARRQVEGAQVGLRSTRPPFAASVSALQGSLSTLDTRLRRLHDEQRGLRRGTTEYERMVRRHHPANPVNRMVPGIGVLARLGGLIEYEFGNLFRGGQYEQEQEAAEEFDAGLVSLDALREYRRGIEARGDVVLAVNAVVIVATMGLGGYLAPAGSTVARSVLVHGALGGFGAMAPLVAANTYSVVAEPNNPEAAARMADDRFSMWEIAGAGLMGTTFGGGMAALGWASRNPTAARGLATLEEGAAIPEVEGLVVRRAGPGRVHVTQPGQAGHMEMTPTGWRVLEPAGESGQLTVLAEGSWADEAVHGPSTFAFGETQFGARATAQGWGVRTTDGIQFGLWEEALPPGPAPLRQLGPGATGQPPPLLAAENIPVIDIDYTQAMASDPTDAATLRFFLEWLDESGPLVRSVRPSGEPAVRAGVRDVLREWNPEARDLLSRLHLSHLVDSVAAGSLEPGRRQVYSLAWDRVNMSLGAQLGNRLNRAGVPVGGRFHIRFVNFPEGVRPNFNALMWEGTPELPLPGPPD